jgi:hypothetical protein
MVVSLKNGDEPKPAPLIFRSGFRWNCSIADNPVYHRATGID